VVYRLPADWFASKRNDYLSKAARVLYLLGEVQALTVFLADLTVLSEAGHEGEGYYRAMSCL
jgi:hypothetical protein